MALAKLLRTMAIGGFLFLLPLVLVILLVTQAIRLAGVVTQPISSFLTLDEVVGPAGEKLLAIAGLVLVTIVAGLAARTGFGGRLRHGFERSFLGGLPQYQMIKSMAEGLAQVEKAEGVSPALVCIEDGWQIGYLLEPLGRGWVAVFLPQAPTPMSGNVMYFPTERVRALEISMAEAMMIVKRMGIGSAAALRTTDLTLPEPR